MVIEFPGRSSRTAQSRHQLRDRDGDHSEIGLLLRLDLQFERLVQIARSLVPDQEFVSPHGKLADPKSTALRRDRRVGMIENQPIGRHPRVNVVSHFDRQPLSHAVNDLRRAGLGSERRDKEILLFLSLTATLKLTDQGAQSP